MSPNKVVLLACHAVDRILYLAEDQTPAHAVADHKSPLPSRRDIPELRESILAALRKKTGAGGQDCFVNVSPEDAAAFSEWCRAVALLCPTDTTMLLAAADTIDNAT